jgi:importin subunit alpha-6/7
MVLKAGALHPLLHQLMQNNKLSMLRNSTWTLSNFCRGKPQPPFDLVRDALGTLSHLIYSNVRGCVPVHFREPLSHQRGICDV